MKILVGLSGGVDSAIAAYLLKQQGHDVTCAFMRNWDSMVNNDMLGNPTLNEEICPQEKDYKDASDVAKLLGLKLERIDFIQEYWQDVFETFLSEYQKGRTPNPDILCNKYIKFDRFMDYAMKQGYEMIATGHYAIVEHNNAGSIMKKAIDLNKDQSYFLCQISQESLKRSLFPLGNMNKFEVRALAEQLGLSIAKKKDSTGICFIGERNFRQFLKNYLPSKPGNIVDVSDGQVLRQHDGVLYYTIGQRKGLNIGGEGGPWFVVGKDVHQNELYVAGQGRDELLYSDECRIVRFNQLFDQDWSKPVHCMAKFRYRQEDKPVILERIDKDTLRCLYPQQVAAVTCGQEAVFYLDDLVLGGGVIDQVYKKGCTMDEWIKREIKK